MNIKKGIIVKAISGFYYVYKSGKVVECKSKGIFRKQKIKPLTGDYVDVEYRDGIFLITNIYDRNNFFIRPSIANLDFVFIVVSSVAPKPNYFVLDKLIAIFEHRGVTPYLVCTKLDLCEMQDFYNIYENTGIKLIKMDYKTDVQIDYIKSLLHNKLSAFAGNSGVGKSTLLNKIDFNLNLKTSIVSEKLGRGKHTTTAVTLYNIYENSFIADTPGFSNLDIDKTNFIDNKDLQYCFREFKDYIHNCKFSDCSHTVERGCSVLKALDNGFIQKSRHKSYMDIYLKSQKLMDWK